MALLDFLASTLPVDANAQSGFTQGAQDYMTRRRAGLENQRLNREENFRKMEMNRAAPAYDINAFGDRIDTFNANQGAGLDTTSAPDMDGGVSQGQDQISDGTNTTTGQRPNAQVFQYLKPTDPVEYDTSYEGGLPLVDPDKIDLPPAATGRNKTNPERKVEVAKRTQVDVQLSGIYKQFGIRRKGGQGTKGVTAQQGDAYKFFQSNEFKNFIYQYPEYIDEIKKDPFAFKEKFAAQQSAPSAVTNARINSPAKADELLTNRTKDILKNDILNSTNAKKVRELATLYGVDPVAALSIFAIESDFGRNAGPSARGAFGSMQVQPETLAGLKTYFADPANKDAIAKAIGADKAAILIDRMTNLTDVTGRAKNLRESEDKIIAGLAYMVYGKAKGIPANLTGAAYQTSVENVISNDFKPTSADDGTLTNYDYNRAYVEIYNTIAKNIPLPGGQTATTTTTTTGSNTAVVDNTGRSMGVNPQGVTDSGGGLKKDGGGSTDKILKNPEDAPKLITELAKNPDQLGFEFSEALKIRNVIAQRTENMRRAGMTGINRPEYAKGIADIMVLDSSLYVMQAYDALNQFGNSGNPDRLNSVIDAFSGGTARIQARTDGKFDFIRPDGSPIEGLTGLDKNGVELNSRTMFDAKYRASIEAAVTAKNQAMFESQLKRDEKQSEILTSGQMDIIKKRLEDAGFKTEITSDGTSMVVTKDGQPVRSYTKQLRDVEGPDNTTLEEEIFVLDSNVFQIEQGVGNAFLDAVSKIGKGQ